MPFLKQIKPELFVEHRDNRWKKMIQRDWVIALQPSDSREASLDDLTSSHPRVLANCALKCEVRGFAFDFKGGAVPVRFQARVAVQPALGMRPVCPP